MTMEEAIADIKAKVADIDVALEMDFNNIVNATRNARHKLGESNNMDKVLVYFDCIHCLENSVTEMRRVLSMRYAYDSVLKMLEGITEEAGQDDED